MQINGGILKIKMIGKSSIGQFDLPVKLKQTLIDVAYGVESQRID